MAAKSSRRAAASRSTAGAWRLGDILTCPLHGISVIIQGDSATLDMGIPLALHGHSGACGCALICTVNATVQA